MTDMKKDIEYQIIDTVDGIDFEKVAEILSFYGLSNLDAKTQRTVFENSYVTIFIKDESHYKEAGFID